MDSAAAAATSRPSVSAATANKGTAIAARKGYGKLLDLADLDGYLLSLLSTDLVEACRYALMAKENILGAAAGIVGSKSLNLKYSNSDNDSEHYNENAGDHNNNNSEGSSQHSSSSSWRWGWWQWEDLLAVATIWASHGQTPGARALGFHLVETSPNNSGSFWWWLLGAIRGGTMNRNNIIKNNIFRNKIVVYAILRVVLPRLYERLKSKALEYANREEPFGGDAIENDEQERPLSLRLQPPPKPMSQHREKNDEGGVGRNGDGNDNDVLKPPCAEASKSNIRALALQRRKLVVKTLVRYLDGVILPSMRLALLVSCWTGHDNGHGGNLALWWSGLSYEQSQLQQPSPPNNKTNTTANSKTNNALTANTTMLPLFVLYAHRRWFHKEAMELFWNKIGRGLLVLHGETSELWSSVSSALVIEWRTRVMRWSYRLDRLLSRNFRGSIDNSIVTRVVVGGGQTTNANNSNDNENGAGFTDNEPCILCGTHRVVVPYRLVECCGKVVCYVCLWERLAATTRKTSTDTTAGVITVSCPVCCQDIQRCEPV
jgi:hypothetical protein